MMTEMSPAAEPPRQPPISEADKKHPRFAEYMIYRGAMIRQLVEASSFPDWLRQAERDTGELMLDPRYPEFLQWMRDNKGGRRPCPVGVFPANFRYWLQGGRW